MTQDARESLTAVGAVLTACALFLSGMWVTRTFDVEIPSWVVNVLIIGYIAVAYRAVRRIRNEKADG